MILCVYACVCMCVYMYACSASQIIYTTGSHSDPPPQETLQWHFKMNYVTLNKGESHDDTVLKISVSSVRT